MVPYGPVWFSMVPYGSVWFCMVSYGPVWSLVVVYDSVWSCVVPFGPLWSCMIPYGPVWSCFSLFWSHKTPFESLCYICLPLFNSRNFCTNFVLVFIHPVYYIFSSFVTLSIRNIFYFLSRMHTIYTVTSQNYFF